MEENKKIRLGISIGDLNGIGCEVVLKTFSDARMLDFCTPVIFASNTSVSHQKQVLDINIAFHGIKDPSQVVEGKLNVVNIWKDAPKVEFGKSSEEMGKLAINSLRAATVALKSGAIDALVTAPINKNNIQSSDFKFPGHTDFLAQELEGESLMFMVADKLRIGLLTDHIAVKDVAQAITTKLINEKVLTMLKSLRMDFAIRKPKIALLGINPHSGDNGTIGQEDEKILKPAIKALFDKGELVFGPYSADSFFGSNTHQNFDGILAAYHDQGLIPFKTLSFGKGVNFTAGLDKVRTSPDHGTAYEIAGQGKADESSFKEAVFMAIQVFKNRDEFKKLTSNPLKKQKAKQSA